MHFPYVLSFLTVCVLELAYSNYTAHTDSNEQCPLEEEEYSTELTVARSYDLSVIHRISDTIIIHQENVEEVFHYLPPAKIFCLTKMNFTMMDIYAYIEVIFKIFAPSPSISFHLPKEINDTKPEKLRTVRCKTLLLSKQRSNAIEIVNSTRLINILKSDPNVTSDDTLGVCIVVYFFSYNCPFSQIVGPHFKLLAHLFPQVKMIAINSINDQWLNFKYNVFGLPTVVLFHNGKPVAKHEYRDYTFYDLTKFMIIHTDLNIGDVNGIYLKEVITAMTRVTPHTHKPDYILWFTWFVIVFWILYYGRSRDFWIRCLEELKYFFYGDYENEN